MTYPNQLLKILSHHEIQYSLFLISDYISIFVSSILW